MQTGLLGTENDQEATAMVALFILHALVGKPNTNPFDQEAGRSLVQNSFSLAREFLKHAKAPEL
jgi:hypothetical protein